MCIYIWDVNTISICAWVYSLPLTHNHTSLLFSKCRQDSGERYACADVRYQGWRLYGRNGLKSMCSCRSEQVVCMSSDDICIWIQTYRSISISVGVSIHRYIHFDIRVSL